MHPKPTAYTVNAASAVVPAAEASLEGLAQIPIKVHLVTSVPVDELADTEVDALIELEQERVRGQLAEVDALHGRLAALRSKLDGGDT